ncbi:MAG: decarboxylating 6-phosphogluconate dehydrogenase [Bacteroidetes bacterium]|nr:MAG: decarboxylating 6-phosphogluconate dehydrogenase [Bacteroidota bacterium]
MDHLETLGLVGLGKMGYHLALNMQRNGFQPLTYDADPAARTRAQEAGLEVREDLQTLCQDLPAPKVVWVMVPAGAPTETVLQELAALLPPGSILIDGGNANYRDSMRRARRLEERGIHLLDCGTSGGISGALNGACTMVGGPRAAFERCEPLLRAISVENGCLYTGPSGSGHFVKMVHNGIEYGMMQAIAEGFEVLERSEFPLDLRAVARVWNHGSVIRSWLIELTESAFEKDPRLESLRGVMHASGEGKWTVETALDLGVPTPVIALALLMRFRSQQEDSFAGKVVAALRNEFGGHAVEKVAP